MVSTIPILPFLKEAGLGDVKYETREAGGAQLLSAKMCAFCVFWVNFLEVLHNEIFMLYFIRIVN